jgi:hypothetical protein
MLRPRAQPDALFTAIGQLAVRWNDLDIQLRRLAYSLTDDWFTVAVFTTDMQVANLIQFIRVLATEHDVELNKLNKFLDVTRPKTRHRVRSRDLIREHVEHALTCAERLRLHRNLYVHCVNSPGIMDSHFTLGGMTARLSGRLSDYLLPLRLREIRKGVAAIRRTTMYIFKVEMCIKANQDNNRSSRPKWPNKPTPYLKLKRPYIALTDRMPLF